LLRLHQAHWYRRTDPGYNEYNTDSANTSARSALLRVGVWLALGLLMPGMT